MSKPKHSAGYKKPPKAGQFKPGTSGNPKGRPKGTKNLATDLQEELSAKIIVREGNKEQKISKQRALVKTIFAKALKGDNSAMNTFLRLIDRTNFEMEEEPELSTVGADDEALINAFLERHLKGENND